VPDESRLSRCRWPHHPARQCLGTTSFIRPTPGRQAQRSSSSRGLAREQAAALAQKEGFLASVCHDVQQPLTVILAQTQLLQRQLARGETIEPERLATKLAYIFTAATRMRGMTQDLLDAAVQQSGRPLALLLAKTELVALTRQAVREHQLVLSGWQGRGARRARRRCRNPAGRPAVRLRPIPPGRKRGWALRGNRYRARQRARVGGTLRRHHLRGKRGGQRQHLRLRALRPPARLPPGEASVPPGAARGRPSSNAKNPLLCLRRGGL
jgi:signal transduction histidine kinase